MKKLLYTIALTGGITFLPAVQGMDSDEIARQAVENARDQIVTIKQMSEEQKREEQTALATLCSFKYDEAMQVFTRKIEEFQKIHNEYMKFIGGDTLSFDKLSQF